VAFGLRDSLELLREMGLTGHAEARITGGGSRSALWRAIVADVLGLPVASTATAEGAAFGAAILAAVGSGRYATVDDAVASSVRTVEVDEPSDPGGYDDAYERYRSLYPALAPTFHAGA
jgi:xylulokinase